MPSITKNIANTGKLAVSGTSTTLGILTNPFVWVFIIILFFPLNLINYIVLYVVNGVVMFANLIIFVAMALIVLIVNVGVFLINIIISIFNDFSISIPIPGIEDPEINFPNLPLFGSIPFPTFGMIPYYEIEEVRIFTKSTILILWILELIGIDFPFGS